ncbi:MAG: hypothetical protein C5B51_08350 [Terriglobia bacterium]|nr:MAG: hypothetical protein C5B51_08350 [Terriglobia bacterium]
MRFMEREDARGEQRSCRLGVSVGSASPGAATFTETSRHGRKVICVIGEKLASPISWMSSLKRREKLSVRNWRLSQSDNTATRVTIAPLLSAMDIKKLIEELSRERDTIIRAIASLEELSDGNGVPVTKDRPQD